MKNPQAGILIESQLEEFKVSIAFKNYLPTQIPILNILAIDVKDSSL